ncbi:hypothetical protein SLEP1_g38364 [Rubroshorea leprosula]|nr:hypothetical protein SLEP1_g38364 [Rubroshorea leprosula]
MNPLNLGIQGLGRLGSTRNPEFLVEPRSEFHEEPKRMMFLVPRGTQQLGFARNPLGSWNPVVEPSNWVSQGTQKDDEEMLKTMLRGAYLPQRKV